MNKFTKFMSNRLNKIACALLGVAWLGAGSALGADALVPDLKGVANGIGAKIPDKAIARWETNVKGRDALFVRGNIWLEDVIFTDGTIECDILGKSGSRGSNFPGLNFRGVDDSTFESIYFRPFNFRAENPENASHAVQYISPPQWTWSKLRAEKTGQYEKPIVPPPDGDAWFRAKIVVQGNKVSVFVNDAPKACLEIETLSDRRAGRVGIGAGDAYFANLRIKPKQAEELP
jgi:hypothetical protein